MHKSNDTFFTDWKIFTIQKKRFFIFFNNVLCRLFEERCISIMDSMYQEDPKHAIDLMDDEANIWGIHSSPLTFAHENFMYEIVAHTCSQKYINIQWYNDLAPDLVPFFKVHVPKNTKKK